MSWSATYPREAFAFNSLGDAAARGIDSFGLTRTRYLIAFIERDEAAMARQLDRLRQSPEQVWTSTIEARAAGFESRIQSAHDLFQRGIQAALRDNVRQLAAQWTIEDAELHAMIGDCAEARRTLQAGIELSRDNFTKDGPAARVQFQSITAHRGGTPASPLFAVAHLGLARAAVLAGDIGAARGAYEAFRTPWNGADKGSLAQTAEQEYAHLR